MYIKFNKENVTVEQLKAIAEILELDDVNDLEWFYNVHYEVCRTEIEYAIENELTIEEILKARNHPKFEDLVNKYADELYDKSNTALDELYENAAYIVDINEVINKCDLE